MKAFGISVLVLLALLVLPWIIQGDDYFLYKYFGPKREEVRRQVFEETRSFRQGLIQELTQMQFAYEHATADEQPRLRQVILRRVRDLPDEDILPNDLKLFVEHLRRER